MSHSEDTHSSVRQLSGNCGTSLYIARGRSANLAAVGATRRMSASPIIPTFQCACYRSCVPQGNEVDTLCFSASYWNEVSFRTSGQHYPKHASHRI